MQWLPTVLASLLSIAIFSVFHNRDVINLFLMGFFRDIGRIKARNRRMGENSKAVVIMEILMHKDDPLKDIDFDSERDNPVPTYSEAELYEFGNGQDGKPLLLSIFGRVYDVSQGQKFYGEGGRYQKFVGRDVTKALSTGCMQDDCILDRDTEGLTEKQIDEGKRWLSFFQLHDKYAYVGQLERGKGMDHIIDNLVQESLEGDKGGVTDRMRGT